MPADQRLADLAAYRADLQRCSRPAFDPRPAGRGVRPLRPAARPARACCTTCWTPSSGTHATRSDYADRAELLDYCRRLANPVGLLLLHLYGVADERSLRRSDAICTRCSSSTSGRT